MSGIFDRLAARAGDLAARATYQASLYVVAASHGLEPAALAARINPNDVRHNRGDARLRAAVRQEAIYCAVVVFGQSYRSVARAAGCSKVAVLKAVRAVEERREDCATDRALDEIELELMA